MTDPVTGVFRTVSQPYVRGNRLMHWWANLPSTRQDRIAALSPVLAILLFLIAIATTFAYLRAEEQARDRSALLQDAAIVVQVSSHAAPLTIGWDGQNYVGTAAAASATFQFCADQQLPLVAGRNWFDTGAVGQGVYTLLCRNDIADSQGHLSSLRVSVSERDQLRVETRAHCDEACGDAQIYTAANVGYAVAIDDVDQNGIAEVYSTAASANADVVSVIELGPAPRSLWKRKFPSGVVALVTGDFDGDGQRDVLAMVRAGRRIEIWSLQ